MPSEYRQLTPEEALPCPFCGEQPYISSGGGSLRVVGCESDLCLVNAFTLEVDRVEALFAWNKRPSEPPQPPTETER